MYRGGSRAAAASKMECFVIIVNGFQSLTIITKHSILDVAAALDPPLNVVIDGYLFEGCTLLFTPGVQKAGILSPLVRSHQVQTFI